MNLPAKLKLKGTPQPASPSSFVECHCTACDEDTVHAILRERQGRAVLCCETCQTTIRKVLTEDRPVAVPVVISEMGRSRTATMELYTDDMVNLDDQIFHEGHNLLVTAIEVPVGGTASPSRGGSPSDSKGASKETRRVTSALAPEISRIWAKVFDRVRVGVAVNRGSVTTSGHCWCIPEEDIYVGDEVYMGGETLVVVAIKTESRKLRDGHTQAQTIKRLYCRPLKGQRDRRSR